MTVESEIRKAPFYAIPNLTEASVAFAMPTSFLPKPRPRFLLTDAIHANLGGDEKFFSLQTVCRIASPTAASLLYAAAVSKSL